MDWTRMVKEEQQAVGTESRPCWCVKACERRDSACSPAGSAAARQVAECRRGFRHRALSLLTLLPFQG